MKRLQLVLAVCAFGIPQSSLAQFNVDTGVGTSIYEVAYLKKQLQEKDDSLAQIRKQLRTLDVIIFKQCMLYPLERRYSSKFVDESLRCLDLLSLESKWPDDYNRFIDLLKNYKAYNEELLQFLKDQKSSFDMKRWNVNAVSAEGSLNKLKQTRYYQVYEKRGTKTADGKPQPSISYLNMQVKTLEQILANPENITEKNILEIIKNLEPRD